MSSENNCEFDVDVGLMEIAQAGKKTVMVELGTRAYGVSLAVCMLCASQDFGFGNCPL